MCLSVLMSLYEKETPEYFDQAMKSIWDQQTLAPAQIVVVQDGPLTQQLTQTLLAWQQRLSNTLTVIGLSRNIGLAGALNEGLKFCNHDLVARMDTSDIALPERFEKQLAFMESNPRLAASSAWVEEFDETQPDVHTLRKVPANPVEIREFAKRRNPLNHPVSIIRREVLTELGGYPPFRRGQDYALWSLMLVRGYRLGNIQEVLLRMRGGEELLRRRGSAYLRHELRVLWYQKRIGFLGWSDLLLNSTARTVARLSPVHVRKMLYGLARR